MIIDKYLNVLTSEHRTRPKFVGTVSEYLNLVGSSADVMELIPVSEYIEDAVGKQLDIIGEFVGAARILPSGIALNDDDFRFLIKAKIAHNNWDGTNEGLREIWNIVFPNNNLIFFDYQDMSCLFVVLGGLTEAQIEMIMSGRIVPKADGVKYEFQFNPLGEKTFSMDMDSVLFAGFDVSNWNFETGQ